MAHKIHSTTDYGKFSYIKGNRGIKKNHLSRLRRSISEKNLLEYNPIIVNENFQIIDGQHRFESAKSSNEPIYYVVGNGLGFDDVVRLNTNVKDWGINDYLNSYCDLGYEEYIKTRKFANKFGLSVSNSIAILSIKGWITKAGYKDFKEGNFEITNMEKATEFAQRLREIAPFCTLNTWKDRDFIRALSKCYAEDIDHDELMNKVQQHIYPIHRRANITEYLRQFEDIYNHDRIDRVRLY